MEKFFESKPIIFLSKFVDLIVLNVIFLISCIPLVTMGASWTAMYYTCVKVLRMDCGKIFEDFSTGFRTNFKTATFVWLVLASAFGLVSSLTYLFMVGGSGSLFAMMIGLCMAMLLFVIATMLYSFPVLSRFTVTGKELLKNAMILSVKHGGETICMIVLTLAFATLVVMGWKFFPLIVLIMPGVYTLLLSVMMEKILVQYTPPVPENRNEGDGVLEEEMLYQEQEKILPWYLEGGEQDE